MIHWSVIFARWTKNYPKQIGEQILGSQKEHEFISECRDGIWKKLIIGSVDLNWPCRIIITFCLNDHVSRASYSPLMSVRKKKIIMRVPFLWGESGTILVMDEATCADSEVMGPFEVSSGGWALAGCSAVRCIYCRFYTCVVCSGVAGCKMFSCWLIWAIVGLSITTVVLGDGVIGHGGGADNNNNRQDRQRLILHVFPYAHSETCSERKHAYVP